MKLFEDLQWRGLVKQYSSDSLIEKLNNGKLTFYIGTFRALFIVLNCKTTS